MKYIILIQKAITSDRDKLRDLAKRKLALLQETADWDKFEELAEKHLSEEIVENIRGRYDKFNRENI
ncbi:MAG: hypothetical protein ACFFDN_02170 [Candidatus Hodarchaeota archaeon]